MRRPAALIYTVLGQQLELMVRGARPTAATFEVFAQYDTDDAVAEFSGSATLDTPSTTLNGAAGPAQSDPNRIPLTSTAGLVTTRRYLLSQNSLQEVVELVEIGSGYARARHPLQNAYSSGATFQSTYLFAAVDAAFIQDDGNLSDMTDATPDYRVKWTITVSGADTVVYSFFDVVRAPVTHSVDPSDLDSAVPGLIDALPIQYRAEGGRPLIDRAWSSVRAEFAAMDIDINAVRDDEVIDELVILRSVLALAMGGWSPPQMDKALYLQTARDEYRRFVEMHFKVTLKHAVVGNDQGEVKRATPFLVK